MKDKDLRSQLEGMFSQEPSEPEVEAAEEKETNQAQLEETIADLLKIEAASVGPEPVLVVPSLSPPTREVSVEAVEEVVESPSHEPLTWDAGLHAQRVRILNILLNSLFVIGTILVGTLLVFALQDTSLFLDYVPFFIAYVALIVVTFVRKLPFALRIIVLIALAYVVGTMTIIIDGPLSLGATYLLLPPIFSSILIRRQVGVAAAVVSAVIYVTMLLSYHIGWIEPGHVYDLGQWPDVLNLGASFAMITIGLAFIQQMFNRTLAGALQEAEKKHGEVLHSQVLLEDQTAKLVAANTLLQERSVQLQTVAQISQAVSSVLDFNELMRQVVNLIREQFGFYYVGIFLLDETGRWAELRGASGETGRQLMEQGYRVEIGGSSIVSWSIINAQARVAQREGGAMTPIEGLSLGKDHSEMTLPLRSRGQVIGALDVQSNVPGAFSRKEVSVMQTLADQIAVAVENVQLFVETQKRLEEAEASQQRVLRAQTMQRAVPIYERTRPDALPLDRIASEIEQAMSARERVLQDNVTDDGGQSSLVVPILLRDEVIGALGLEESEGEWQWTEEDIALVESIADQMALAIENARLLEQTQQRAERERLIAEISTRVRASMDPEIILKTTVRELSRALGAERATVQVTGPTGERALDRREPRQGEEG